MVVFQLHLHVHVAIKVENTNLLICLSAWKILLKYKPFGDVVNSARGLGLLVPMPFKAKRRN